jgi:hypothetical protein
MVDAKMENATLVRRTLVTAGAMLGACVAVVATLTVVAVLAVGHAVGSSSPGAASDGVVQPGTLRGAPVPGMSPIGAPALQRK